MGPAGSGTQGRQSVIAYGAIQTVFTEAAFTVSAQCYRDPTTLRITLLVQLHNNAAGGMPYWFIKTSAVASPVVFAYTGLVDAFSASSPYPIEPQEEMDFTFGSGGDGGPFAKVTIAELPNQLAAGEGCHFFVTAMTY